MSSECHNQNRTAIVYFGSTAAHRPSRAGVSIFLWAIMTEVSFTKLSYLNHKPG
jgi:hypothetical protein